MEAFLKYWKAAHTPAHPAKITEVSFGLLEFFLMQLKRNALCVTCSEVGVGTELFLKASLTFVSRSLLVIPCVP